MEQSKNVYELAINKAKDWNAFSETRGKFVEVLSKEAATLNEGKWKPFFTFGEMDLEPVLIGMTHWSSMEGFGEAGMRLLPQEAAKNYFATFDPLVYGVLETIDGQAFDMATIKATGLVVEFAIRTGKTIDAFGENRDKFFMSLENYDGYKFSREFKYYEMNEQGMPVLQENTQAVIIVWESAAQFQSAVPGIMQSPESAAFMSMLDVKAYFASSPTESY
ncbi:MAG TPA: hypothetical protein PKA00_08845 [Saprospiraceae bacterium]|nr:hypothetical protein [Saprospiraceae bacterium]HMQ83002.1 hypothetical protein [Saprospiraceae bacterium]